MLTHQLDNHNHINQQLSSLISKQSDQHISHSGQYSGSHRRNAVEWILTVVSHHSFTTLTAVLAVNYLDRFFDRFDEMDIKKKPWMFQLVAVSCLSIAAKVDETRVPLLQHLQEVDGISGYVFEAKTVHKMEVLVLSTLEWKMNPVTPISFVEYVTRRVGFKSRRVSLEFVKRYGRFRCHLPSVIATATMVHAINTFEPCIRTQFQSQLLTILGNNKKEVEKCWLQMQEVLRSRSSGRCKRKFGSVPGSPDDVMDLSLSSDESWSVVNLTVSSSLEPEAKKSRNGAP
ncbi:hypothetical protein QVD17_25187 [Tagetes erecta]|uniref:B-like cyclin n=1 Tax=Tagetes erecta TaxID=13708 RepID=A0AAD8NVD3_TARER|nr:hypothetical protein QVD17_25187 [Tagetes erecta]